MTPPILGIFASAVTGGVSTTSFESIATVSVGSGGSATITFSSIPGTYSHLQLRFIAQDNRGTFNNSELRLRFNSDTGSNYRAHYLVGDGSSASAADNGSISYMPANVTATAAGSIFSATIVDILDYANTNKYTTSRVLDSRELNGSGAIFLRSYLWLNTNAITSITIESNLGSSLNQYSHFALYGIKGA